MALVDIGNGVKQFVADDPTKEIESVLSLQALVAKQKQAEASAQFDALKTQEKKLDIAQKMQEQGIISPTGKFADEAKKRELENKKLEEERQKAEFERRKARDEHVLRQYSVYMGGDAVRATKNLQESGDLKKNQSLEAHPTKGTNWAIIRDTDSGETQEVNVLQALGVDKFVDERVKLISDAKRQAKLGRPQFIQQEGQKYSENLNMPIKEAQDLAASIYDRAWGTPGPDGRISDDPNLWANQTDDEVRKSVEREAKLKIAGMDSDPLAGRSLRKLKPLDTDRDKSLAANLETLDETFQGILPRVFEITNGGSEKLKLNILRSKVNRLGEVADLNDKHITALNTLLGNSVVQYRKLISGGTVSDTERAELLALKPNDSDTVQNLLSKSMAWSAIAARSAVRKIRDAQAQGEDVGNRAALFLPKAYGGRIQEDDDFSRVSADIIRKQMRANSIGIEQIDMLSATMTPTMRKHFQKKLLETGDHGVETIKALRPPKRKGP